MASIKNIKASDGTGNASIATVQNSRSPGASTIIVDTVAGINAAGFMGSMGTPHTFTDPVTSETITVISEATAVDFAGHVDSGHLVIDTIAPGYTDAGSEVGDIVIVRPTTQYADNVASVLEAAHNDDGTPSSAGIHYAMPAGAVVPYAGAAAPTGFLLCNGASVLRTTYADLFTAIGTAFGSVDGTHFTLPDMRGRTPVGVGSNTYSFTFASTDVNTGTDQIAVTANSELITGRKIQLTTTGTLPTGLAAATDYYMIVVDSTHIKLATTLSNAVNNTAIDITGAGSGTNTGTGTGTARTLAEHGGEQNHSITTTELASHSHQKASNYGAGGGISDATVWAEVSSAVPIDYQTGLTGGNAAHNNMQPYLTLNYIIKT
jgi:microcystin-dependent protein